MRINGTPCTLWSAADNEAVEIIDQARLPRIFTTLWLENIRSAPLIGVMAAYVLAPVMRHHAMAPHT